MTDVCIVLRVDEKFVKPDQLVEIKRALPRIVANGLKDSLGETLPINVRVNIPVWTHLIYDHLDETDLVLQVEITADDNPTRRANFRDRVQLMKNNVLDLLRKVGVGPIHGELKLRLVPEESWLF